MMDTCTTCGTELRQSVERCPRCPDPFDRNNPPTPGEKCGHIDMQGFDVVLECARGLHTDDLHETRIGQRWHCEGVDLDPNAPHSAIRSALESPSLPDEGDSSNE